jgi:DNA-binding response OmpR family regulator
MRILIVEDEPRMLELLRKGLYEHGFTVMAAADGESGLETATAYELDAIVLDIGLPRMDGYGLMQALRARECRTPVLVLTARDSEDEMIRGLDLGADDYLTKPFSFPELVARLQAITRHQRQEDDRIDHNIDLTRLELLLLTSLMRRAGQCVPRQTLMEFVWGADHLVGPGTLDVLVNSLRAKIDAPYEKKLIGTVRGIGYIFKRDAPSGKETQ